MLSYFFSPFTHIYCISLRTSHSRRKHTEKELKKYRLSNYTFIDAVTAESKLVNSLYSNSTVKCYPPCFRCEEKECNCDNNVLISSQVATFCSHMNIWKIIAKQKNGLYLITEDDIVLNRYYQTYKYLFHWKINNLFSNYTKTPFLLRLGWAHNHEHFNTKIRFEHGLIKMSNPMYAINPQMARILLSNFRHIDTTVDIYIHKRISTQYTNYTLLPPLAHELSWSTGDMESLIRPRNKRIEYLKNKKDKSSMEELKKYDEHIDKAVNKKILAVGHPRTGSGYVSALLKSYEIDAKHEKMGEDGIVSWMFTVYDLQNPFYLDKYAKSKYYSSFDHTIMFARDPWTAISSIMRENDASEISFLFRAKHILKETKIDLLQYSNDFEKAIEGYYLWSKMAIKLNSPDFIMRVEYDDKNLYNYLQQKEIKISAQPKDLPSKDINSNKPYKGKLVEKPLLSKEDWLNLDISFKFKLNELCEMFGYEPIFNKTFTKLSR